jgi:phosphoglycolate phosphatase-like HAD superfamily hydrolase
MDSIRPHGKTDPSIIREVFNARGQSQVDLPIISQILDAYVGFLAEEVKASANRYRVLPGILPFLQAFSGHPEVALGLATGNVEGGARIKLGHGDLNRYFSFGGFGSDAENRTLLVERAVQKGVEALGRTFAPDEVFVIGDTPRDVQAGREAGFQTVGVATGGDSSEILAASGAGLVIEDLDQGRDQFLRFTRIV